ncbi:hypothetical protein ABU614_06525 [Lysobacter firmicutimachus]|uniref:Uncharacterized protein n=1 Tax=Lysobacter firmicutimachus TaxID=1792846 RepID=A0AAU8MVT1_9GAMM
MRSPSKKTHGPGLGAPALARAVAELAKAALCGLAAFVVCAAWHPDRRPAPSLSVLSPLAGAPAATMTVEVSPPAPLSQRMGIAPRLR